MPLQLMIQNLALKLLHARTVLVFARQLELLNLGLVAPGQRLLQIIDDALFIPALLGALRSALMDAVVDH